VHLYESNGQPAKALPLARKMVADKPNSRFCMELLSGVYERMGKTREAQQWNRRANPLPPLVGQQGANLMLKTLTGGPDSLKAILQGKKALILTFWYIACPPCRAELPHLQKLYQQYRDRGLEILAVNPVDTPEQIRSFVARQASLSRSAECSPAATPMKTCCGNIAWNPSRPATCWMSMARSYGVAWASARRPPKISAKPLPHLALEPRQ
jgi:thiol-disulfide isomerase/thioredoxin